ncbi:MAG TPA: hypothetical protein GX500_01825 [Firmicutes bacterium]|nr:hypothetical protein [Candidatus Fermentithermobacillaceae bacterium]
MEEKNDVTARETGPQHVHDFFGRTSVDRGHFHTFTGSTNIQTVVAGGHAHEYAAETRVAANHTHRLNGLSSIEMPVMMGHVHRLQGTTTVDDNHSHTYDIYTGLPRAPRNVRRGRFFGPFSIRGEGAEAQKEPRPLRRLRFRKTEAGEKQ